MAEPITHEKQAQHNEKIATKLVNSPFIDWAVTCAFYSALHYVESKLIDHPKAGHSEKKFEELKETMQEQLKIKSVHAYREFMVGQLFPNVRTQYSQLRYMREAVSYIEKSNKKCGFEFITPATAKKAIQDLKEIRDEVKKANFTSST
jgi:hypothetical protein